MLRCHLLAICLVANIYRGVSEECTGEELECTWGETPTCIQSVYQCDGISDCYKDQDEILDTCTKRPPVFPAQCPARYTQVGDSCYTVDPQLNHDWPEGHNACRRLQGFLAEPQTSIRNSQLKDLVRASGSDYWLGATDLVKEGEWRWNHSGRPVHYTDWHTSPTNDVTRNCLAMRARFSLQWYAGMCGDKRSALCEAKKDLAVFSFSGYRYTSTHLVNAGRTRTLEAFEGQVEITLADNNTADIFTEMQVWAGLGRRQENLVCKLNLSAAPNKGPLAVPNEGPCSIISKKRLQWHFRIQAPVFFPQGTQRLWALINPNLRPSDPKERNKRAKHVGHIGHLPLYYRVHLGIGDSRDTTTIESGDEVEVFNHLTVDIRLCLDVAASNLRLNFTSIVRGDTQETLEVQRSEVKKLCHNYPDVKLPTKIRVSWSSDVTHWKAVNYIVNLNTGGVYVHRDLIRFGLTIVAGCSAFALIFFIGFCIHYWREWQLFKVLLESISAEPALTEELST